MADESQQMMQMHTQPQQQMHSQPQQQMQPTQMQTLQAQHSQQQPPQQQQQPQSQPQPQPQQQQPQQQQQAVAVTMALANNMDQTNAMNQQNTMSINAAMNVSQSQTMGGAQVSVNDNSGTPVHMTVPQLTASPAQTPAPTAVMSQSSAPHPTMLHPAMSMAQSPLQQVQVIQQPLSASYLQQLYTPQQQMLFPGNLTLQHAGMGAPTLQSIGAAQGLSLQLQTKTNHLDPKTSVAGQTLQAVNATNKGISFTASNMMTATGQVLGPGTKANFQQQVMAGPGKQAIIHGQPQFAPGNANQTVVIGPLGVLPNQQSVFNQKALADSQKKTYMVNQPAALQPKSPLFSSSLPPHSSGQVFNGNQLKQLTSSPQLITSQSPGTVFSQAQLLGSLQALGASLPQGISWATPGLQSPALLAQNPIFIRSQQSDMFIQSQPQAAVHLPVASTPLPPTTYASTAIAPQKPKQVRMRPGSSVATQTMVSTVATVQSNTPPFRTQVQPGSSVATQTVVATVQANTTPFRTQIKAKPRTISSHFTPASAQQIPQIATTQTQTNQALRQLMPPPSTPQLAANVHPRSDASNQTKPVPEMKSIATQSKAVETEAKHLSPQKSQAKVAPSTKIITKNAPPVPVSTTVVVSVTTSTVTDSSITMASSTLMTPPHIALQGIQVDSEELDRNVQTEPVETAPLQAEVKPLPDISHEIRPMPSVVKDKDRHPQKAIVKPHVLTHVIDGYIIQEGPEPFPVSRSSLLTDINIPKPAPVEAPPERTRVVEKRRKIHRVQGPVELAKCEFCGKLGAKSKFKRSKRFCSTSCAKRYNVCCSKRLGLLSPPTQENILVGGRKKKKMGFKTRKGTRKGEGGRLAYNTSDWQQQEQQNNDSSEQVEETMEIEDLGKVSDAVNESITITENPVPANVVLPQKESMEVDPPEMGSNTPAKSFNKYTVNEVFEFIRDLAGCSDYADEFRSQEIDGQALLLLKEDHLMSAMGMKLGPALKLIARIDSIKGEIAHS